MILPKLRYFPCTWRRYVAPKHVYLPDYKEWVAEDLRPYIHCHENLKPRSVQCSRLSLFFGFSTHGPVGKDKKHADLHP
jgi:hypothetical protein